MLCSLFVVSNCLCHGVCLKPVPHACAKKVLQKCQPVDLELRASKSQQNFRFSYSDEQNMRFVYFSPFIMKIQNRAAIVALGCFRIISLNLTLGRQMRFLAAVKALTFPKHIETLLFISKQVTGNQHKKGYDNFLLSDQLCSLGMPITLEEMDLAHSSGMK